MPTIFLVDETPPLLRDDASRFVFETADRDFGYDPFATEQDNAAALARMREWLQR